MSQKCHSKTVVLVTGASGYLGAHCVKELLAQGYSVKGTVRSLQNEAKVQPLLDLAAPFPPGRLQLVEADLILESSWEPAIEGCDYVLHVASPFPIVADESILQVAVEGTLNVLRACAKCASVRKVVLTSSCAAVNEGFDEQDRVFSEEDWSNVESKNVLAYCRSKTEAKKAAWEFVRNLEGEQNQFQLTCLNPTLIVGPVLIDTQGTSITLIRRFFSFLEMPLVPSLQMALVDVVDVAKAHVLAMDSPQTDGQRILLTWQPSFWFKDIAKVLAKEFHSQGYYFPRYQAPYSFIWLYSFLDAEARAALGRVDRKVKFDNSKARKLLGLEMRNPERSIIEMAYSMIERGILPKRPEFGGRRAKAGEEVKENTE